MPHTLTITKAHAYGNDFLFAAGDAVGDADLPALARTSARGTPASAATG